MKKVIITSILALLLLGSPALAKQLVVAVIDTGVDPAAEIKLCPTGHYDFVTKSASPVDYHGHGTHIASTIQNNAGKGDYCIVSIKYHNPSAPGSVNLDNMIKAVEYAVALNVDYINISGGGPEYSEKEYQAIKKALDKGMVVVAAAGNDHTNIDPKDNKYYPASYDKRIVVVGNKSVDGKRSPSSNYGDTVTRWEVGEGVRANIPCTSTTAHPPCSGKLSGTSQACAIATGKLLNQRLSK